MTISAHHARRPEPHRRAQPVASTRRATAAPRAATPNDEHRRQQRREGERLDDADPLAEAAHQRDLDRAGEPGDGRQGDCECGSAGHGGQSTLYRQPRRRSCGSRLHAVRAGARRRARTRSTPSSAGRCRARTFRHGKVFGSPMGDPKHAYYAELEFADKDAFKAGARSDEFMATGKDAMQRGIPLPRPLRGRRVSEPDASAPASTRGARLRADRLREGAAARDDHVQPAGGAERVRLPDAARDRARVRGRVLGRRHPRRRPHRRRAARSASAPT